MEAHLAYKDSRSNKEYHLVMEYLNGKYKVTAKFGPRDGTLTHVDKTKGWTTYENALKLFRKTENEKRSKGYEDLETPRQALIRRLKNDSKLVSWLSSNEWDRLAAVVEEIIEEQI